MRTRTKLVLLGGLAIASLALVHCVGDDPSAAPPSGDDAGGDGGPISDTGPASDTGPSGDAGPDAASSCAAGVSPCIVQIAGGGQNFCARDDQGKVYCWGLNADGQLGASPTATAFSATPLNVSLGAGVVASGVDVGGPRAASTLGESVACARVTTGSGPATMKCWGSNQYGQLAVSPDASTTFDEEGGAFSATPVDVPTLTDVLSIAVGALHVCAIAGANNVQCWGDNNSGELGRDTVPNIDPNPEPVTFAGGTPQVDQVVVGARHMCTLNKQSTPIDRVGCAGQNVVGQLGRGDAGTFDTQTNTTIFEVDGPIYAAKISANGNATCALFTNGSLHCWGENGQGEMGTGSAFAAAYDPVVPTGLSGGTKVTGITSGFDHFCALLDVADPTDGAAPQNVFCWGRNDTGQSSPTTAAAGAMVLVPTPLPGLPDRAIAIAAGSQASCALIQGGAVYCWGENYVGELGNGDPGDAGISGPVKVTF